MRSVHESGVCGGGLFLMVIIVSGVYCFNMVEFVTTKVTSVSAEVTIVEKVGRKSSFSRVRNKWRQLHLVE